MQTRRILIVDDDKSIRDVLVEALASIHVETEAVESGLEALLRLGDRHFDLVLLDLRLPGVPGMDVLREVRNSSPETPVIVITADSGVGSVVETMQAGAAGFIVKPFVPDDIRSAVMKALDHNLQERLSDDSYQDHIRLAKGSLMERRLAAAGEHARRALALKPSKPAPFNIMGVIMQLKMQIAEAQKYYRSALALDDGFSPARKNLENLSSFPKELSHFEIDE